MADNPRQLRQARLIWRLGSFATDPRETKLADVLLWSMPWPSVSPATITMGKILSKIAPKMGVLALDVNNISKDPEVVAAYVNDPLVFHGKTPARLATELLKAMLHVTAEVDKITLPFIVLQGSEDKLVDPAGALMLYENASSKDKTIKVYDGLYHEVFNEPERARVLKDVEIWLAAHL